MTKHILIVDDREDDIFLSKRTLKKACPGCEMSTAMDGEAALLRLMDEHSDLPDLVFLDIKIPKIDGLEVLRRLREQERTSTVPVVVISSSTYEGDIQKAENLGAEYLVKPLDLKEFYNAMEDIVKKVIGERGEE